MCFTMYAVWGWSGDSAWRPVGPSSGLVLYKSPTPKHLLIIEISQSGISKKSNEYKKLKSHFIQDFCGETHENTNCVYMKFFWTPSDILHSSKIITQPPEASQLGQRAVEASQHQQCWPPTLIDRRDSWTSVFLESTSFPHSVFLIAPLPAYWAREGGSEHHLGQRDHQSFSVGGDYSLITHFFATFSNSSHAFYEEIYWALIFKYIFWY